MIVFLEKFLVKTIQKGVFHKEYPLLLLLDYFANPVWLISGLTGQFLEFSPEAYFGTFEFFLLRGIYG